MTDSADRLKVLEEEIERRLVERFAALRDEFDRLRLESDRRWAGFLDRFDQRFTGIVPLELISPAEPASASPPAPSSGSLPVQAARLLDDAGNQVEALHRFLDLCLRHASRAAILVSRSGSVGVWKAVGFSEHGGSDEATRRAAPPSSPGTLMARVLEGQACELPSDNEVSRALSADDPVRAVLIAMTVKEKISGALYADCVEGEKDKFDPEALAFLTFLAGVVVDRLAGRKWRPAPALSELELIAAASPAPEAPPQAAEPEFELASEAPASAAEPPTYGTPDFGARPDHGAQMMDSSATPTPEPAHPAVPPPPQFYGLPSDEAAPEPQRPTQAPFGRPSRDAEEPSVVTPEPSSLELAPPQPEPHDSGVTMRIASSMIEAAAVSPPPEPEPIRPPAPSTVPPRPSTGARRLAGPLAPADGDERREEARRFAKLLVSEIKLYNEKAVQQGRQQGNIYQLLKEDIDRSRQMYDERIPQDVRSGSNFFYEELVRILADGRSEALGL